MTQRVGSHEISTHGGFSSTSTTPSLTTIG